MRTIADLVYESLNAPVVKQVQGDPHKWMYQCPGCESAHMIDDRRWRFNGNTGQPATADLPADGAAPFNGNTRKPSFAPSVLVTWEYGEPRTKHVCHSYVRGGVIEFLNDCTHKLAGQKVALPPI